MTQSHGTTGRDAALAAVPVTIRIEARHAGQRDPH
jgi:hypothetical protein